MNTNEFLSTIHKQLEVDSVLSISSVLFGLARDELTTIEQYSAVQGILQNSGLDEDDIDFIRSTFEEIIADELDHVKKFKAIAMTLGNYHEAKD